MHKLKPRPHPLAKDKGNLSVSVGKACRLIFLQSSIFVDSFLRSVRPQIQETMRVRRRPCAQRPCMQNKDLQICLRSLEGEPLEVYLLERSILGDLCPIDQVIKAGTKTKLRTIICM